MATTPISEQHNSTPLSPPSGPPSSSLLGTEGASPPLLKRQANKGSLGRLATLFAILLGLLCFIVSFSISNFGKMIEADRWNVHTYRVLIQSGEVLESIVAMDTGVRSFFTTGDEALLKPYTEGQISFEQRATHLAEMTADKPEQGRRIQALRAQLAQWQAIVTPSLGVRRSIADDTRSLAITTRSAAARTAKLNEMRLSIEGIQNYEESLLRERSSQQGRFQGETERTMLIGGAFSIVLAIGLCAIVLSNTHALGRTNHSLESTNSELARVISELAEQKQQVEAANREMQARRGELARLIASLEHANGELGRSNAELEQFAYVASHDLQEPLRAVAGCVQVLQKRYKGQLDARADQFIHHAVDGAQRMQNLINDLLLFSRVGTRGKPFAPASFDDVLKRVLQNLSVSARESNAAITAEPLPTLSCDAGQIEQVLQNLLANALKFRRPLENAGGEISGAEKGEKGEKKLMSPVVHIGGRHDVQAKEWIVSVRDNGPGIESKYFERIWIMFQRLHTRTDYEGTGIGLAVCKKIIERHGGRVGIDSQTEGPEQGSTFWFALPEHPVVLGSMVGVPDEAQAGHNESGALSNFASASASASTAAPSSGGR